MTMSILLVQAPGVPARTLAEQLSLQGFAVRIRDPGTLAVAPGADTGMILLDADSAAEGPVAACRRLREQGAGQPIIVLGVQPDAGLRSAGATDAIAKPFRLSALMTTIRRHARTDAAADGLVIGPFRLDPIGRHLEDGAGRRIRLTEKETAILAYLHRAGSRVVPRDELLGEVWGYSGAVSTHTVETYIYRLRRKLDDDGQPLLVTEGGGYRLGA
jgi:DNA-binding response OmpR family regulator